MLLVGEKSHGSNRKIYTGYTHHLMTRVSQHSGLSQTKGARLTRKQRIELVYLEKYSSQKLAMKREWQFKHESPYNQKKSKLVLIKEFQKTYGHILNEFNNKLEKHFEFLEDMIKSMKNTEKVLIKNLDNNL